MHIPKRFEIQDSNVISKYIEDNPFATLISPSEGSLVATHTVFRPYNGKLVSHISAVNEQAKVLSSDQEFLAIFMQNHAYISSSWYDHVNVPTWNYMAVHVYGKVKILDRDDTVALLNDVVNHFEEGRENAFHIDQMTDKSLNAHLKGLVAFEMSMDRIEASWKLSQNRDDKNFQSIIDHLYEEKDLLAHLIADEMSKLR